MIVLDEWIGSAVMTGGCGQDGAVGDGTTWRVVKLGLVRLQHPDLAPTIEEQRHRSSP